MKRVVLLLLCIAAARLEAGTAAPQSSDVRLQTMSGVVHGTMLVPAGDAKVPVVLFISGSGPTDRDGNVGVLPGKNDSLRMLAEALAARGIASVRYDKRGIAASAAAGPKEVDLRFETYVADAKGWVAQLKANERFSSVIVAGHSEGSLIGMLASGAADGFLSISGPSMPAGAVLREQLRTKLPPDLLKENERILTSLEAGKTVEDVPGPLFAVYRRSVQPYLISWMKYDPSKELAKLTIPVFIVQGSTDVQVGVADARRLQRASPKASLAIIEGMNHVLKLVDGDAAQQLPSYGNPDLPLAPRLVDHVVLFVKSVDRDR